MKRKGKVDRGRPRGGKRKGNVDRGRQRGGERKAKTQREEYEMKCLLQQTATDCEEMGSVHPSSPHTALSFIKTQFS